MTLCETCEMIGYCLHSPALVKENCPGYVQGEQTAEPKDEPSNQAKE